MDVLAENGVVVVRDAAEADRCGDHTTQDQHPLSTAIASLHGFCHPPRSLLTSLDEDLEYARRRKAAGVDCALQVVPGASHGFDALFPKAEVSRQFWRDQAKALTRAWAATG